MKAMKKFNALNFAGSISVLCATLLTACSSIPKLVPDMSMQSPRSVQIEGKHGALSAQQSKAILTKLGKYSDDTNIFDRHLALEEQIVDGPLVAGNQVNLLIDGPSTYKAMFTAIENAKNHINLETFTIEDDEIGQRFIRLLTRKQQSGVQVNLIYDSVGSINTSDAFFKPLINSGGNVLEYNPVNPLDARKGWDVNQRDHRKLLIVDGNIAFTGGINISSVYSSSISSRTKPDNSSDEVSWRDTHVQVSGPIVNEFQKLFISTWNKQKGDPLIEKNYYPEIKTLGKEVVRAIGSSPDEPYSQIYVTLLSAINSAETKIQITNAYFVPDQQLIDALKQASMRGVDVNLLLPSKSDSELVFHASRSFFDDLLSSKIKIYERQDALLHAKTAIIDGVWSTIGSTNLDWRSFVYNQEINAVILGQDFGRQLQIVFEKDLESSKLITLKEWRKRSISLRIKERAARLWARFL